MKDIYIEAKENMGPLHYIVTLLSPQYYEANNIQDFVDHRHNTQKTRNLSLLYTGFISEPAIIFENVRLQCKPYGYHLSDRTNTLFVFEPPNILFPCFSSLKENIQPGWFDEVIILYHKERDYASLLATTKELTWKRKREPTLNLEIKLQESF